MLGSSNEKDATRSIFLSSVKQFANTGAVAVAFLATPILYDLSVGYIHVFTIQHYGSAFADLMNIPWFGIVAVLSFFGARASVATLVLTGGFAVARKLF